MPGNFVNIVVQTMSASARVVKTRAKIPRAWRNHGEAHYSLHPFFPLVSALCRIIKKFISWCFIQEPDMGDIIDDSRLREHRYVFRDRHDAGRQLGAFIRTLHGVNNPLVLAIPAGGVPIGKEVARVLGAPFSLAIVRKIRIPGTTESGFGAVTWDGTVLINEPLRSALGLSGQEVEQAVAVTRENVSERVARFMGEKPVPAMKGKTVILTDDGLASGFTMLAAVQGIRHHKPVQILVAVPTASASSAGLVAREADLLVCLNIRSGRSFAVADASRYGTISMTAR